MAIVDPEYLRKARIEAEYDTSGEERLRKAIMSDIASTVGPSDTLAGAAARYVAPMDRTAMYLESITGNLPQEKLNQRMSLLGAAAGVTPLGNIREPSTAEMILSQIPLALTGSAAARGGMALTEKVLGKITGREINKLIAKETVGKKLLEEGVDILAQGITTTPQDLVSGKTEFDEEGMQGYVAEGTKDFIKALGVNLAFDTAITATILGGARGYMKFKEKQGLSKRFTSDKNAAYIGLDTKALQSINEKGVAASVGAPIEPNGFVDIQKLDKAGAEYSASSAEKQQLQDIDERERRALGELSMQGRPDPAAEAAIRRRYAKERSRVKAKGKGLGYTLDDIQSDNRFSGAFIDGDEFLIKTPALGSIRGNIIDGALIADLTKSDVSDFAKLNKYGGMDIVTPLSENEIRIARSMARAAKQSDISAFSELSSGYIDETGKFKAYPNKAAEFKRRYGLSPEDLARGNETIVSIEKAGVKPSKPLGSNAFIKSEPLPVAQTIMADVVEDMTKLPKDLQNLKAIIDEFKGILSTELERTATSLRMTAEELSSIDGKRREGIYDLFFESKKTEDGKQWTVPKKQVKDAIDAAYAMELAKLGENAAETPANLARKTVNTAMDLLGIKPGEASSGGANIELAKAELTSLVEKAAKTPLDEAKWYYDETTGTISRGSGISKDTLERMQTLGKTQEARQSAIENITRFGVRPEKEGLRFTENITESSIRNKYGMRDQTIVDAAKTQAQTPFYIHNRTFKRISELSKKDDIDLWPIISDKLRGTKEQRKRVYDNMEPGLRDSIDDAVRDMRIQIESIINMKNAADEAKATDLYWDVEIDQTGRIRYIGNTTPQNSKLARAVFRPVNTEFPLFDAAGSAVDAQKIEFAKRAMLAHFGKKPEYIKTAADVDSEFSSLVDTLLSWDESLQKYTRRKGPKVDKLLATLYDDNAMSFLVVDDLADIATELRLKTGKAVPVLSEADGKVNGVALNYAALGIEDSR